MTSFKHDSALKKPSSPCYQELTPPDSPKELAIRQTPVKVLEHLSDVLGKVLSDLKIEFLLTLPSSKTSSS
ncbi:hypothetical protein N7467_002317 [Penicillium canescens]|nr:hypothetical protein N7467_002317 [Penicillium canescens]